MASHQSYSETMLKWNDVIRGPPVNFFPFLWCFAHWVPSLEGCFFFGVPSFWVLSLLFHILILQNSEDISFSGKSFLYSLPPTAVWISWWAVKYLTTSSSKKEGEALIFSICQCPWCKYSHQDQFQSTKICATGPNWPWAWSWEEMGKLMGDNSSHLWLDQTPAFAVPQQPH